jgi:acyl-CoA thioester hydrolase
MKQFVLPVRVYYEDTDAGGVVYYANYLRFMERARTEWLRALGYEQDELSDGDGIVFAVRRVEVDFLKPARFNDALTVSADVIQAGKASMTFMQEIRRGDERLCSAEVRLACIDKVRFIPRAIPKAMLEEITKDTE